MPFTLPTDASAVSKGDLRRLTNELLDMVARMLRRCVDADVTFTPLDPHASDPDATSGDEATVAWTLPHILVHMTATAEESATVAAELARGVTYHGRSRREVPWETVQTIAQCRARLEESRRMRCASLDLWPDQPDLANTYVPWEGASPMGPVARFLLGPRHDAAHLEQLADVIAQARAHRRQRTLLGRLVSRTGRDAKQQTLA